MAVSFWTSDARHGLRSLHHRKLSEQTQGGSRGIEQLLQVVAIWMHFMRRI